VVLNHPFSSSFAKNETRVEKKKQPSNAVAPSAQQLAQLRKNREANKANPQKSKPSTNKYKSYK